jgi:hypothetical protein
MTTELLFFFGTILVVGVNIQWYRIKNVLKENDYEVSYFWRHGADIVNMVRLIKKTEDPGKRLSYQRMLGLLVLGVILFVGGAIIIFIYQNNRL